MKTLIGSVAKSINAVSTFNKEKSADHGEVFTPNELIFETLQTLPKESWNSNTTFLDPCAGKGNYGIYIIKHLFLHLQQQIPDEEERLKHIIENQLYMVELQRESAEFIADTFKFGKDFKVNLYFGNALEMPEDFFDLSWEERREKYPENCMID